MPVALRSGSEETDKYGKHQGKVNQQRLGVLALFIGLSIGFVAAERFYLSQNTAQGKLPPWYGSATVRDASASSRLGQDAPTRGEHLTQLGEPSTLADSVVSESLPVVPAVSRKAAYTSSELQDLLETIAPTKEVMIAISDFNLVREGMLTTFLKCVKRSGMTNYLVVGLDDEIYKHLKSQGVPVYYKNKKIAAAQAGTGNNHAISALKFGIIKEFLVLGWSVLLSDVDVVVVQNPFDHLYRDSDVEGMSDGYDEPTAYGFVDGYDDPSMGWARYAQAMKHMNFNSGLFYLRSNDRTINLMQRLEERLAKQKYWDQTAYNEEIFFLSHGSYKSPQITVRVMDIHDFMNSKVALLPSLVLYLFAHMTSHGVLIILLPCCTPPGSVQVRTQEGPCTATQASDGAH